MKHPERDEWMSYLYDEVNAPQRATLEGHLRECAECAEALADWRVTTKELQQWKLPLPRLQPAAAVAFPLPLLRWGLAALFVLGVGLGFGKFLRPPEADTARLQAALLPVLREELRAELKADLVSALGAGETANPFQQDLRVLFASWSEAQSAGQRETLLVALGGLTTVIQQARAEDRQAMSAIWQRMRRDLETVAVVAESQFQKTENQLGQLVSFNRPPAQQ